MPTRQTYTSNRLSIDLIQSEEEVRLQWRGWSTDRAPDQFIVPVMLKALECGEDGLRQVVMDFAEVEYMNSSSFAPLVKMLEQSAKGTGRVRLEYLKNRKWQALSFSALRVFETADGRVSVHAK